MSNKEVDKEIAELEELVFGATDEGKDDEEGATDLSDSEGSKETGDQQAEAKDVAEQTEPKPETSQEKIEVKRDERDWKFEYRKVRADSDRFKYEARQTMKSLRAEVADLKDKLKASEKEVDVFKDTFTEEEVSKLGDDAITVIKKASKTASDAVRTEMESKLDEERTRRQNAEKIAIEAKSKAEHTNFLERLARVVPKYDEIDHDVRFEKFLYQEDPINGGPRINWFREANSKRDVMTIAGYMKDFEKEYMSPKVDKLATETSPVTASSAADIPTSTNAKDPEVWAVSEMEEFYDSVNRGKYKLKPSLLQKHQELWDTRVEKGLIDYTR